MNERDVHGPIDTLVIEFPGAGDGSKTAKAMLDIIDRGLVRLYDLVVVRKGADGRCVEVDLSATTDGHLGAFAALAGARSGLVGGDDLEALEDVLRPGTAALVFVYENTWALPFVAAALDEGGEVVASVRYTVQQIMDALDTVEATV